MMFNYNWEVDGMSVECKKWGINEKINEHIANKMNTFSLLISLLSLYEMYVSDKLLYIYRLTNNTKP